MNFDDVKRGRGKYVYCVYELVFVYLVGLLTVLFIVVVLLMLLVWFGLGKKSRDNTTLRI